MQSAGIPVISFGIAGDGPQASHAAVVDSRERAAVLPDPPIAERSVFEAVFSNPLVLLNVEEHAEDLVGCRIAVIEEELRVRGAGIPVHHRALLGIPSPSFFDFAGSVMVLGIEQDDVRGVIRGGHAVMKPDPQREQVAPRAVPGDVLDVADIAEVVVLRALGDLLDFELEGRFPPGGTWLGLAREKGAE